MHGIFAIGIGKLAHNFIENSRDNQLDLLAADLLAENTQNAESRPHNYLIIELQIINFFDLTGCEMKFVNQ